MIVRRLLVSLLLLAIASAVFADDARTQRLETLCRVWAAAKYTHPAMLTRDVDWDGALMRAIPAVRTAPTPADLAAAIDGMLKELGDPATHVLPPRDMEKKDVPVMKNDGDVLVVNLGPSVVNGSLWPKVREMGAAVDNATSVVIDISTNGDADAASRVDRILSSGPWSSTRVEGVSSWGTMYSGYAPQQGTTSGGYFSALLMREGAPLMPAKKPVSRIVFVTDPMTPLPDTVVTLWRANKATLVSSGPVNDAALVQSIDLPGNYHALIRTADFALSGIAADRVSASPIDEAVKIARSTEPLPPHNAQARLMPVVRRPIESAYPEMTSPDLPHRLLAAFRIWSVIHYFYPYKPLIGDWDAVLHEFIPRFEEAEGNEAYLRAVMEMTAHIEDGHTTVTNPGPSAANVVGPAFLPFGVRPIEGEAVIYDKRASTAPVEVGDVIVSIDGEPVAERVRQLWKYLPASTEAARRVRVLAAATRGPADSVAQLEVRGADGSTRAVSVPRIMQSAPVQPPATPAYRLLDSDTGYADLSRLTTSEVDPMFDAFIKTRAIIFDLRGYPKGTAWSIAPRINTRGARVGASFRRQVVSGDMPVDGPSSGYFFEQPLPTTDKPLYRGKIVVLIDDRAISQSEHTCLFFEQAAGATFIGTPTAGANGDVTNFALPGGVSVLFTGHDVRHADGRQLQRVGIQPDIRVEPTIAGIRAGKDEVLDRALAYLKNGK